MGKESGTQTQSRAPWGPAQSSLIFGLNELNRIYGQQTGRSVPAQAQTSFNGFGFNPAPYANVWQPNGWGMAPGVSAGVPGYQWRRQPTQPVQTPSSGPQTPFSIDEFGLLDPAAQELKATIGGQRFNQNPALSMNNQFENDVIARAMNDVNSVFEGQGRYGSGAQLDTLFTKAAAPIRYQNFNDVRNLTNADYARERQNQLAAVQAAPGFEMAPYQLFSARQAAPYEGLRNYLGLANAVAGQGGEASQPIYKNPLAGALGGGLAGAGLSTALGFTGPWGAAAGALIGLLG